jgi:MYXO-CTERM domain-containing protein
MKTFAYNLFAATVIASATVPASAEMLTFEDLPNPTTEIGQNLKVAAMPRMYNGFSFTSLNSAESDEEDIFDNRWGYYKMRSGSTFMGFDEGIIGGRALFTPWGAEEDYQFSINRNDLFVFEGAYFTQVNREDNDLNFDGDGDGERNYSILTITGFVGDTQVYSYSTQVEYAVRQFVPLDMSVGVNRLVISTNTGAAIALDNFTYSTGTVPAPGALALLGLAGIVGRRRR